MIEEVDTGRGGMSCKRKGMLLDIFEKLWIGIGLASIDSRNNRGNISHTAMRKVSMVRQCIETRARAALISRSRCNIGINSGSGYMLGGWIKSSLTFHVFVLGSIRTFCCFILLS